MTHPFVKVRDGAMIQHRVLTEYRSALARESVNRFTVAQRNAQFRFPEPPALDLSFSPQSYSRYFTRARPLFASVWAAAGK